MGFARGCHVVGASLPPPHGWNKLRAGNGYGRGRSGTTGGNGGVRMGVLLGADRPRGHRLTRREEMQWVKEGGVGRS